MKDSAISLLNGSEFAGSESKLNHCITHSFLSPVADPEGVPWVPWNPPFCENVNNETPLSCENVNNGTPLLREC